LLPRVSEFDAIAITSRRPFDAGGGCAVFGAGDG
jgi:hypothetical protein